MTRFFRIAAVLAALFAAQASALFAFPASAQDKPTPEQVRRLTLRAAEMISTDGLEAARPAFYAQGEFRFGEIYINVIDLNGAWVVYPPAPKNEGKSVLNVTDTDGKLLVRHIIAVAVDDDEGWVEYRWLNPAVNRIEPKLTFVKRVRGTDLIAYAGIYRP